MKDFSLSPYNLGEIGFAVEKIGTVLGIECTLCSIPSLRAEGYYSIPTLSEDICKIAASFGISVGDVTGDLKTTGVQLQALIVALKATGHLNDW